MTTNPYFTNPNTGIGSQSEQDLIEGIIIETIQLAGNNWQYLPRTVYDLDPILNEDPNSSFEKGYTIEMYQQNATSYGGQGYLLSKFGVEVNDTVELLVSRKRFTRETQLSKPKEGDLLYNPILKALFEINFIEFDAVPNLYQLSKNFVWLMKASFFTYSYEQFDTGIKQIDKEFDPSTFTDPFKQNVPIGDEANTALDFSEENPFGEVPTEEGHS